MHDEESQQNLEEVYKKDIQIVVNTVEYYCQHRTKEVEQVVEEALAILLKKYKK